MGIFFIESVKQYTSQNIWVFWTAFFISIGFLIGLTCCGDVRRKSPHNMILLSGFTVAEGLMLGVACSTYTAESVLMGKNYESNNKWILIQDITKINCKMYNYFLSFIHLQPLEYVHWSFWAWQYLPCKPKLILQCAMESCLYLCCAWWSLAFFAQYFQVTYWMLFMPPLERSFSRATSLLTLNWWWAGNTNTTWTPKNMSLRPSIFTLISSIYFSWFCLL